MMADKQRKRLVGDGLVTVVEAAGFLGIGRSKTYDLMDKGLLPYVKIGKARRIPRRALVDYAARGLRSGRYEGGSNNDE